MTHFPIVILAPKQDSVPGSVRCHPIRSHFSPVPSFVRRIYNADFKMQIYLQIARLFLEEQDHISAEAYINRAAMLQSEVPDKELQIKYKVGHSVESL